MYCIFICLWIVNLIKFFKPAVQSLKSESKREIGEVTPFAIVWPALIGVRLTMQQFYKSPRAGNQGHMNINEAQFRIYC